jgi:stage III sporulation protein AE
MELYNSEAETELSFDDAGEYIYDILGISEAGQSLNQSGLNLDVDIAYMIKCIAGGNLQETGTYMADRLKSALVSEIVENRQLMLAMIIIIILGSVFTRMTVSYGNSGISENGFFVTYMLMTSVSLMAFNIGFDVVEVSLKRLIVLLRIIVPVFMVSMNFVGHTLSATAAYQLVMIGIWLVQAVFVRVLLPMVRFYVIMSMINNLNREKYFTRLADFIASSVYFCLKTVVVFVAGLNLIKGLIGPQLDMIGKSSVNRIINTVTGGGVTGMLTGTFLASGMVIKNSVGIVAVCLMLVLFTAPVIKLFVLKAMVRISAIIVEPVGDKRYVDGIDMLSRGLGMLLKVMCTALVLFVLSLAIAAFTTNS